MKILFALAVFSMIFLFLGIVSADPTGANITQVVKVERAPVNQTPSSNQASAGNVTELSLFASSLTSTWQGYFGNVSGTLQLTDASLRAMYNWSQVVSQGEVYASTNQTITWGNIQCFNFTATGTLSTGGETAGATSLNGTNLSTLEQQFNISFDDADGVNETFTLLGVGTHDAFVTASQQFTEGECRSTRVFDNTGQGINNKFEEVLLYEPVSTSVIFTALLEDTLAGFDNAAHDFEMLVLENGHGTDVSSTPYYFFIELG